MAEPMIDTTLARFQHTGIALVSLLAATSDSVWLILFALVVTALAAVVGPKASLPVWAYERFIRVSVEPNPTKFVREEPERFGLMLVTVAITAALVSYNLDGSGLAGLILGVVVLHEFAAAFGFCLACRVHRLLPNAD